MHRRDSHVEHRRTVAPQGRGTVGAPTVERVERAVHEVSIAQAIVAAVSDAVGGERVQRVDVTVGALSGVAAPALEFAWEVATANTAMAGSVLVVESVPTTVFCPTCGKVVEPPVGFVCPGCGELSGDVRSGLELEVRSARLRDPGQTSS